VKRTSIVGWRKPKSQKGRYKHSARRSAAFKYMIGWHHRIKERKTIEQPFKNFIGSTLRKCCDESAACSSALGPHGRQDKAPWHL
jgi:hypothetical protein